MITASTNQPIIPDGDVVSGNWWTTLHCQCTREDQWREHSIPQYVTVLLPSCSMFIKFVMVLVTVSKMEILKPDAIKCVVDDNFVHVPARLSTSGEKWNCATGYWQTGEFEHYKLSNRSLLTLHINSLRQASLRFWQQYGITNWQLIPRVSDYRRWWVYDRIPYQVK